jgi:hypothetical protein
MSPLRFTLVAEGPTDAVLLHPLRWLLIACGVRKAIEPAWADFRQLPTRPANLQGRIETALQLYPCELLFVHRDADRCPRADRIEEIQHAVQRVASDRLSNRPYVCVIPVRMTEAWFLFDEAAIRRAAGNPAGEVPLSLPSLSKIEDLPDPKASLRGLLREATELPARRLRRFNESQAFRRLADLIDDFGPVRSLPAFAALESELRMVIRQAGWGIDE